MTEPPSIPYASAASQQSVDDGHLKAIAICHYVLGGLAMLFSCFFIFYIALGVAFVTGRMNTAPSPGAAPTPTWLGYYFIAFGSIAIVIGWTMGILTIFSGRCIAQRNRWVFSVVIAGLNCMFFPLGTTLSVFTFMVLLKPSVKALYPA